MRGPNYLFVFLKKKLSNIEKHVSNVRIYKKGPLSPEKVRDVAELHILAVFIVKMMKYKVKQ
jgi:hypothetical protein